MLMMSFLSWWYGRGWKQVMESFGPRMRSVANNFSVAQLMRTLFEPWRRIITYPGASLEEKFHAWGDNVFSRGMGFVIRFWVLVGALFTAIAVVAFTAVEIIVWPLLPLAIPGCLIAGLVL